MTCWGKKKRVRKRTASILWTTGPSPFLLQTADRAVKKNERETNGWECLSSAAGLFPMLLLSLILCFFIKGCYSLACRGFPLPLGTAALCWLYSGTAEACLFPIVGLSPSEQLQTPGHVIHHLLLTHDGQDGAGARLNLPKNKRVWLIAWILSVLMPGSFAEF